MEMIPIISLHLPKTAGTSFVYTLKNYFGEKIFLDYSDLPISISIQARAKSAIQKSLEIADSGLLGWKCVHGHFLPFKYLLLSTHTKLHFITWMRHPLYRAISHYNYWQKTYDPRTSLPHQKKVIEGCWSLEDFCFSNEYRNLYSQYLWGFPLEYFKFIGVTEFFDEDFKFFTKKWLSIDVKPTRLNNSNPCFEVDHEFIKTFEEFHANDMNLYRRALEMRLLRS